MASLKRIDEIARKTVQGSFYSGMAAIITFVLGFVRSILLARLLLPEHFGVMTLAFFFVGLSHPLFGFGLDSACLHHQNKTESFKATYFSLRVGLSSLKTAILLIIAPALQWLYPQMAQLQEVLFVLAIVIFVLGLSMIQITFIRKELAFMSLAVTDIAASVMMTIAAPVAAWLGWGVWALVVEYASNVFIRCIFVWGLFRRWRPRFGWDRHAGKLFWQFGKPIWVKMNVDYLLNRFDDFWIGSLLGQTPLGYYAKAYDLAGTPYRVCAFPFLKVFVPVFARLQHDRQKLSQVFFRCAYLLIRLVFLGAGLFAIIIPGFIHLIIGEKWLPMLWTFRLLILYAAFDSFLELINGLFIAVGKPEVLRNITLVQAAFFIPAVIVGAHLAGINGVAIAADGMLLIGLWRIYRPLLAIVDISLRRLLGWPVLSLILALWIAITLESFAPIPSEQLVFLTTGSFLLVFGGILLLMERKDYVNDVKEVWKILKHSDIGLD